MQIRRKLQYENVEVAPTESFAARQFRQEKFPFEWHYHPEIELTLIVKGRGMRFVGDSVEPFAEGDLCLLGANLPHTWSSDPADARVHPRVIQFRAGFWGEPFDALPEIQPIRRLLARAAVGFEIAGASRPRTTARMNDLFAMPVGSVTRLATLLQVLGELAGASSRELRPLAASVPAAFAPDDQSDAVIGAILRRLSAAPSQPPKQSELARLAGVSAPVLSRWFQRRVGTTYPQYINGWRLARVCQDLAATDRSITDIALDVGYANLSNFNRRFKQAKGMTPSEYRRLAQGYP